MRICSPSVNRWTILLLMAHCGGGAPPRSLDPGVRFDAVHLTRAMVKLPEETGAVRDSVRCSGSLFVAGGGLCVLDGRLAAKRCVTFGLANVPSDLSIALRPDCTGYVLLRESLAKGRDYHLFDVDGRRIRDVALSRQGTAALLGDGAGIDLVVAEDGVGITAYDAATGDRKGMVSNHFSSDVRVGNLESQGLPTVVMDDNDALSILSLDGVTLGVIRPAGLSFAIARAEIGERGSIVVRRENRMDLYSRAGDLTESLALPPVEPYTHVANAARTPRFFVTLLGGRGGWHRTILLVHRFTGEIAYHEVLDGDYRVVRPLGASDFVVFGRDHAIRYGVPATQ